MEITLTVVVSKVMRNGFQHAPRAFSISRPGLICSSFTMPDILTASKQQCATYRNQTYSILHGPTVTCASAGKVKTVELEAYGRLIMSLGCLHN